MPSKDLYNGDETKIWTDTYNDGERFVEVIFFSNGVSMAIPADNFHIIADEIMKASKMLELFENKLAS